MSTNTSSPQDGKRIGQDNTPQYRFASATVVPPSYGTSFSSNSRSTNGPQSTTSLGQRQTMLAPIQSLSGAAPFPSQNANALFSSIPLALWNQQHLPNTAFPIPQAIPSPQLLSGYRPTQVPSNPLYNYLSPQPRNNVITSNFMEQHPRQLGLYHAQDQLTQSCMDLLSQGMLSSIAPPPSQVMQQQLLRNMMDVGLAASSPASIPLPSGDTSDSSMQQQLQQQQQKRVILCDDAKEEKAAKLYYQYHSLKEKVHVQSLGRNAKSLRELMVLAGFDDSSSNDLAIQARIRRKEEKMRTSNLLRLDKLHVPPPSDEKLVQQYKALEKAACEYYTEQQNLGAFPKAIKINNAIQLPIEKDKDNSVYKSLRGSFQDSGLYLEPDDLKKKLRGHVLAHFPELQLHKVANISLILASGQNGQPIHIDAASQKIGPSENVFVLYLSYGFPGTTYWKLEDVQKIEVAEDLLRLWPNAPVDLVPRIKGSDQAQKLLQDFGAVFLASCGERIETREAERFSMAGLDAIQPHCAPSTLGRKKVRAIIFFTMTPPDFVGEEYSGDTQMTQEKLCMLLRDSLLGGVNARDVKKDECLKFLFDKFLEYTSDSASRGTRDYTIRLKDNDLEKAVESLIKTSREGAEKKREADASAAKKKREAASLLHPPEKKRRKRS